MAEDNLPPFPPPQNFMEMEFAPPLGEGGSFSGTRTAAPYDLVDDLPGYQHNKKGWQTTKARGGAVHYSGDISWTLGAAVPPIDRAFYFSVDGNDVGLYGFWGDENNPLWSFVVRTKSSESKMTLFNQSSTIYFEVLVKSGNSSLWGYTESAQRNYKLIADNTKAALLAWDTEGSKYITISTEHFPGDQTLTVQLREIDICDTDANGDPMKMLVLCSQPYSPE